MPIVLSSKIYMIHFDNASTGWLDLDSKSQNRLAFEATSGRKTYQVIAGDSWSKLMENYTHLTGRQPLLPRWALGNFSSRFGYHSQAEAEATIKKFRDYNIPVDAIILDLYWFGRDIKGTMGNLEPLRDSFPDFEGMVKKFQSDNVHTIPITEPFILTTSKRWNEAASQGILATDANGKPATYDFYFGNTGLIDVFKPKGRDWFWNIYKDLANKGAAGVWGDLGEPEVHPSWVQHATGTANEVHNIYGAEWAKLIADGYKKDFPNVRPFILMRSGYSGSQRFGMIPWSGDVNRTWGGLFGQTEIALQMGMQGMGFMHSDLGGFAGENRDPELYLRWLQYGVFQPIFRPHAQEEVPSEPVFWDNATRESAKIAIELRYRLLPYNYTAAFKNSQSGIPLMRPLFFEEPNYDFLYDKSSNYLWGDDILVAPITEKGQPAVEVYFPKNSNWYDAYGKMYKGGSHLQVRTRPDEIPYFFRGGSFIPVMPQKVKSTADYNPNEIHVNYIFDPTVKESTGMLYDDDGLTADAYARGEYEILRFESKLKANKLYFIITPETGKNWKPRQRNLTFTIFVNNRVVDLPVKLKAGKETKAFIKIPTR
jgi:oligosaccharide 4-alpha-D-glucosyltransferase